MLPIQDAAQRFAALAFVVLTEPADQLVVLPVAGKSAIQLFSHRY
jgi:hypothetical protein